jgi:hypothetical protein
VEGYPLCRVQIATDLKEEKGKIRSALASAKLRHILDSPIPAKALHAYCKVNVPVPTWFSFISYRNAN